MAAVVVGAVVVVCAVVVVAAVGKAGFVPGDWIKPGAAVFDVGINRTADGKLIGTGGNQMSMVCDEAFVISECQFNWPFGRPLPETGIGTLPILSVRLNVHKDYSTYYIDHPAINPTTMIDPGIVAQRGDVTAPVIAPQTSFWQAIANAVGKAIELMKGPPR